MVTRFAWFFTVPCLIRVGRLPTDPASRRQPLVSAWRGMQGTVSLAVALALPSTTRGGGAFPQRILIMLGRCPRPFAPDVRWYLPLRTCFRRSVTPTG